MIFSKGSCINLEMQVVNEHNWPERSTLYACRNFSKQNKGLKYNNIKPVYQIGFLDYTLFPEHPSFYASYKLTDVKTHHLFTDKLSIRVVDLTNISLATAEDKRYNIDKWAKLFKAKTWEDIKMLAERALGTCHHERGNFDKRKAEGCISVEMECAAVQAMCDFRDLDVYYFLTSGDLLDSPKWDARMKKDQKKNTQHDPGHFDIALELAVYVSSI